jgi:hypothetical protein
MKDNTGAGRGTTRRQLLRGAAVGTTALAATSLLSPVDAWADPRGRGGSQYVEGVEVLPDTSHAARALVSHIRGYFQAKSDKNLDWQMSSFSSERFTYIDAILGWHWYAWKDMRDALAGWYPTWPKDSKSYPTRLLGDTSSAILVFTDTPGMFGPGQVRNFGAVNFGRDGRIERWVDYWDARQFGVAGWRKEEEPPAQWPSNFRESTVGETASPLMRHVATRLANALQADDIPAAMRLFSTDAVYEDVPAHLQITSRSSIHTFLTKAAHPALRRRRHRRTARAGRRHGRRLRVDRRRQPDPPRHHRPRTRPLGQDRTPHRRLERCLRRRCHAHRPRREGHRAMTPGASTSPPAGTAQHPAP